MTENEMVGWHHRLNGQEFEQAPGVADGQRGLACSPWGGRVRHNPANDTHTHQHSKKKKKLMILNCGVGNDS